MQMIDYYLRSNEEEKAVKCFEEYVEHMIHAEDIFRKSMFFGDLRENIRFISNGSLVSLEAFREEQVHGVLDKRLQQSLLTRAARMGCRYKSMLLRIKGSE